MGPWVEEEQRFQKEFLDCFTAAVRYKIQWLDFIFERIFTRFDEIIYYDPWLIPVK